MTATAIVQDDEQIAARHAEILGSEPRVSLLDIDNLPPDSDRLGNFLDEMAVVRDPGGDYAGKASAILPLMMLHPDLFHLQAALGAQFLVRGALPPRLREIVILRVGWLCGAPYEWGEHVAFAKQADVSSDEIERIKRGAEAPGWTGEEQAALRAVDELRAGAMISDPTWAVLAETLDEKQLIELPILIGQYQTVAYYQNSLRVPLHGKNEGLTMR